MPSIATRSFGTVQCAPEDIVRFPAGIAPFDSTQFVLIANERKRPLVFLQSADSPELCFVTVPVTALDAEYALVVQPDDLELLGWGGERPPALDDVTCLVILTIPESGEITANLLSPVLINTPRGVGVQCVRADARYRHDVPLSALAGVRQPC